MKIIYDDLTTTACSYWEVSIDNKHIICLNSPVCSATGEETEIDIHFLYGKSFQESVNILHDNYSGDIVIMVVEGDDFAIIRPPFSEFIVFYTFDKK